MNSGFVPCKIMRPREDRVARFAGAWVYALTFVRTGLRIPKIYRVSGPPSTPSTPAHLYVWVAHRYIDNIVIWFAWCIIWFAWCIIWFAWCIWFACGMRGRSARRSKGFWLDCVTSLLQLSSELCNFTELCFVGSAEALVDLMEPLNLVFQSLEGLSFALSESNLCFPIYSATSLRRSQKFGSRGDKKESPRRYNLPLSSGQGRGRPPRTLV
jgi:hypothetical protein